MGKAERRLKLTVTGAHGLPLDIELVQFRPWSWMLAYWQECPPDTPGNKNVSSYSRGGAVFAWTARRALKRVFGARQAQSLHAAMFAKPSDV